MWVKLENNDDSGPDGLDMSLFKEELHYYHVWFDKHRMKTDFKWRLEKIDELNQEKGERSEIRSSLVSWINWDEWIPGIIHNMLILISINM